MNVDDVRRIAVIGAGLMGHGIAQEFAVAGYEVNLTDTNAEVLTNSIDRMRANLHTMVELGLVESTEAAVAPERIRTFSALTAAVAEADVVIEATSEDLTLKQRLFETLDAVCGPDVILASNSSSFMPSEIGLHVSHPGRVLVTHYFNPPYLLPIVELVRGPQTDTEVVGTMYALFERIGKRPAIIKKEARGFVGNRLQMALLREAMSIVAQGIASPEDVDTVVRFGFGRRLAAAGPFEIGDAGGADLTAAVATNLLPYIEDSKELPPWVQTMLAAGGQGMKNGLGFRHWTPEQSAITRERISRSLAATSKQLDG